MSSSKQHNQPPGQAVDAYHNEAFDIGFFDYFKNVKDNKISQVLNSMDRKVTFETISYRQLNSWGQQGLLNGNREGREWRRFSIIDALWVKIIDELRSFGMSWEQIKVAKESLAFESKKCGVAMPLLEFYTAFAIGSKMPVLLLTFKDGITVPCSLTQYKVAKESVGVSNHLQISLNDMLQGFFPNTDLKPSYQNQMPLTVEEIKLLSFIRVKKFEKVEVRYKNGKMDLIEGLENVSNRKKIDEILREQKFASIELIEENGQVTRVLRKIKKKL